MPEPSLAINKYKCIYNSRETPLSRPPILSDHITEDLRRLIVSGDLRPGEYKTVAVGDRELALYNVDGKFCATDNVCPHRGGK